MPRDLRFALRRLARTPGFVAAAVTCLALGAVAGFLPARRATRADPMIAIRAK